MSDESTKRLAVIFKQDATAENAAQAENRDLILFIHSLRKAVCSEVRRLNSELSSEMLLMTDREFGFQFNFRNQLTLLVDIGQDLVVLKPTRANAENPAPHKFQVLRSEDGCHYKGISQNPTVVTPIITEERLIEGLLRVAGRKEF
jgi:hypothetical protein